MKYRRRYNTQTTIRKKNVTTSLPPVYQEPTHKLRKFFKFLTFIIILSACGYFGYNNVLPLIISDGREAAAQVEENAVEDSHSFPVEDKKPKPSQDYSPIQKRIQLEILNGCGQQGIAKILSQKLKRYKYDVINSGNYLEKGKIKWDVSKSKIIEHNGNIVQAKDLAERMGIKSKFVESYENPSSTIADITIIIGKDWEKLSIFKQR